MTGSITTSPPVIELPPGSSPSSIAKGDTGAAGPSNVLAIGAVSGGVTAAATITGSSPNQVLNLTLPQGPAGPTGQTGPSGAVGVTGTPTANQFATWNNSTTTQGVSITGIVKGNGASAPAAAVAGTDYLAPPVGTALLKGNSGAALANAVAGTDYAVATSGSVPLKGNGSGGFSAAGAADIETLFALGNWKVDYLNGSNVRTAVALGADKTIFASNGAAAAPTMRTAANLGILEFGVSATISVGYSLTPNNIGTVSSGTTTPAAASGNYQYLTNNGAFTLAAPLADCAIDILVTNGASAGSITFSGFTVGSSIGSALTTTNTSKFIISIRRINSVATYSIYALQ